MTLVANKLRKLAPSQSPSKDLRAAEALEIITAFRRGVSLEVIGKTIGRTRMAMMYTLGVWALKHAAIKGNGK